MPARQVRSTSTGQADWWDKWLQVRAARLRGQTRLRVFATTLEIVQPRAAAAISSTVPAEPLDHALRVDLLIGMIADTGPAQRFGLALVRQGPPEVFETDRAWIPAVLVAADIAEVSIPRVGIVTRWGGLDTTPA